MCEAEPRKRKGKMLSGKKEKRKEKPSPQC